MTKLIVLLFARGRSPSLSASGLPLLAAISLGPKWGCEARRKWWAHQDLNLGPIDYEDPGDLASVTLR